MGLGGRVLRLLLLLGWAIGIDNQRPAPNSLDVRHQGAGMWDRFGPAIIGRHRQENRNAASPRSAFIGQRTPIICWPEDAHVRDVQTDMLLNVLKKDVFSEIKAKR